MTGHIKLATYCCICFIACCTAAYAQQQMIGAPPEASNMRLVGANDLQARSAYQPTIHHQGERWIAYIGHHGGSPDICITFQARKESMREAARRWCASATARRCPREIATRSICCALSAAKRM